MAKKPAAKAAPKPSLQNVPATLPPTIVNAVPAAAEIAKALRLIEKLRPEFEQQLKAAHKGGSVKMARAFVAFHRLDELHKEAWGPFSKLFDAYKKETIPELFEQEGVPNVPLDEGFRVGISSKFYASIKSDDDEAKAIKLKTGAYDWLRKNGLGDLITPTVNSSALSSAAKDMVENQNKELPSEFFVVAMVPNTSVTKLK